jgi:hypothetical protein
VKTREQILEAIEAGKKSQCLDGRDFSRLTGYFPVTQWSLLGCSLKEGEEPPQPRELTRINILADLKRDVGFGFEKALNKRGISSGIMFEVVKMWLWVLDDPLQYFNDDDYAQYGLPLFKAVALKFGFDNPIGNDTGSEKKYSQEGDE